MQKQSSAHWFAALLFPAVLIYYEVLLRVTTVRGLFQLGSVFMVLLCAAYGLIGYLLISISRSKTCNHIIAVCLTGLTAIPFLVEYFIFRQFNLFYDVSTVLGGASDAVTGFAGAVFELLFSWNGILMIILFLLPAVLLLIFGKQLLPDGSADLQKRLLAIGMLTIFFFSTRLTLKLIKPLELLWTTQYNYQTAVSTFGLLTGIGLDVRDITSGPDSNFEQVTFPVITTPTETTVAPTETTAADSTEQTERSRKSQR